MQEWLKNNYKKCLVVFIILIILLGIIYWLLRKPIYEVTFDSNGGTAISSVKVKKGDKVPSPIDPVKDGYIFEGWEYQNELYDFDKPVNKDMTLKALWNEEEPKISLKNNSITLVPGEEVTLDVILTGSIKMSDLVFTSSDKDIATVNQNGKITAVKEGKVQITVKTKDGKNSVTCNVVVANKVIEVEKISITGGTKVTVGETIKLTAVITPNDATNKNVTWKSSDTNIATVDKNGNVKGLKAGTVIITAVTDNGKEAMRTINVEAKKENPNPEPPKDVAVKGVTLEGATSVNVGETISLTVKIEPNNATNKGFTCSSNNTGIATVDSKTCKVTGVSQGEVEITVTTTDGNYTATHKVTVKVKEVPKPVYEVHFTAVYNNNHDITSYKVTVYKDGNVWDGYSSIVYNGKTSKFKENAIPAMIDTSITEAQIKVDGEIIATATVKYD